MSKLRRKFIAVLAVLFCVLLLLSTALFIPKTEKTANAFNNTSNAVTLVTKDTSSGKVFDYSSLTALFNKLTGKTNATYSDVESMFQTGSERYSGIDLFVNAGKSAYDVVLDDKYWNPVYLSKNTDGDIVLTLWLADVPDDLKTKGLMYSAFFSGLNTTMGVKYTSEMYSASILREYLTGKPYAISTTATHSGSSIQSNIWKNFVNDYGSYITAPNKVQWQRSESAMVSLVYRGTGSCATDFINEDAAADGSKNYIYGAFGTQYSDYYYDWANDSLWVPSITETGTSSTVDALGRGWYGLWYPRDRIITGSVTATEHDALVNAHLINQKHLWLRGSGGYDSQFATTNFVGYAISNMGIQFVCGFSDSPTYGQASIEVPNTNDSFGLRPAFHFNLTKAYSPLPVPGDVENVYTGTKQELGDLTQKPDWYSKFTTVYDNSSKIKVEYPTGNFDMLNASTDNGYEIKITILDTDHYRWANATGVNDVERKIKFKITRKKVRVDLSPPANNKVETGDFNNYPKAEYVSGEIAANDLPNGVNYSTNYPTLITKYKNNDTGETFDSVNNKPTKPGHYTATAEIDSSVVNKNYEIITDDPTHPHTVDFVIVPYTVAKPTYSYSGDLVYNASAYTINVSSTDHVKYTVKKDGVVVTVENNKLENLTETSFKVIDAGVYTITFTIVDQYYAWSDTVESNGSIDNADYTAPSFTIKQKELSINLDGSDNPDTVDFEGGEWGVNTQVKFKINVTGEEGDDKVILYVYYTDKDGNDETPAGRDNDYYVILGQTEKSSGYKLYVKLADPKVSGNAVNANYYIDYKGNPYVEKPFTISTAKAPFKESDLKWIFKNSAVENGQGNIASGGEVTYNGAVYTVMLESDYYEHLKALGVKLDTSYGKDGYDGEITATNAREAAYTVTVKIIAFSEDYEFTAKTYTFEWYITPADFDLSSVTVKWQYRARGEAYDYKDGAPYEGGTAAGGTTGQIIVFISGLPDWFEPTYSSQAGYKNSGYELGDYTAKILKLTSSNDNYNDVTDFTEFSWATLEWKIVQHVLSTAEELWSEADYADGKVTAAPTLNTSPYNVPLIYKYYDTADCSGEEIAFADLKYEEGEEKTYYVKAFLNSSSDPDIEDKWALDEKSDYANNPFEFTVGANKIAVKITVKAGGTYDGTPKEAGVELVSPVDGISADSSFVFTYYKANSNTALDGAPTDAGNYRVVVSLKAGYADYYISGDKSFDFTIDTLKITVPPEKLENLTYDGTEQDIAKLVGLPDDWDKYITITITTTTTGVNNPDGHTIKVVADYEVIFKIKSGINDNADNVLWDDEANPRTQKKTTVSIVMLTLHAEGWEEDGYDSYLVFTEKGGSNFVVYTVYDEDGKVVDKDTADNTIGTYTVKVTIAEEHIGNVEIVFAAGVSNQYEFITTGGQAPVKVTVPKIPDLTFNGTTQTFTVDYGGFEEYIEIDTSLSNVQDLTQFNADEYTVYFKIKSGKNAVWTTTGDRKSIAVTFEMKALILEDPKVPENQKFTYTGSEQFAILNIDGAILAQFLDVDGDYTAINAGEYHFTLSIKESFAGNVVWASATSDKSVDWTIEKAKITVKWTDSEVPELDLPEEFKDLDVEYEIKDENGNVVTRDQMEAGGTYTITAKLADGSEANFEFVDDSGKTLKNPTTTDGLGFKYKDGGSSFPWWILALIAGVLALAAVLIIVIVKRRQVADGDDDYDDFYDDEYDFDEEEYEDDGEDFGDDFE